MRERSEFISKDYSGVFHQSVPDATEDQRQARWDPPHHRRNETAHTRASQQVDHTGRREDYTALRSKSRSRSRSPLSHSNNEDKRGDYISQEPQICSGQRSMVTAHTGQITMDHRDESFNSVANRDQKSIR